jgi:hypothetical protein
MQPGDLVRIKRASIGMSAGTLALLMESHPFSAGVHGEGSNIWRVSIIGSARRLTGRYLEGDLETVSASR